MKLRFSRWWQLLFTVSLTFSLLIGQVSFTKAQSSEASQLVQQGVIEYQNQQYQKAIASWNQALTSYQEAEDQPNTAIILENLARAYQKLGQTEQAIAFWEQVTEQYQELGDIQQLGRSLTEQAQAYSRLGQHRLAIAILCGGNEILNQYPAPNLEESQECQSGTASALAVAQNDQLGKVAAFGSLGEAYRLRGYYNQALYYLDRSLDLAQTIDNPRLKISALNSLGNTYNSLALISYRRAESAERRGEIFGDDSLMNIEIQTAAERDKQALDSFQDALKLATQEQNSLAQIRNIISILPIYYRLQQYDLAETQKELALSLIPTLPPQQTTVYATIDLAKLLQPERVTYTTCLNPDNLLQSRALLEKAMTLANQIGDQRAGSFALGELGHSYECEGNYQKALEITQQARLAAEKAKDSLYLWEWQTGRILLAQDRQEEAINAYETAIATLESIRDDLLNANRDIQFDFRDTVEPIYRELIKQRLGTEEDTLVIEASQPARVNNSNSKFKLLGRVKREIRGGIGEHKFQKMLPTFK